MPELLEVEIYRSIAERAKHRTIASVDAPDVMVAPEGDALAALLPGQRFIGARRIGKLLLMDVDEGSTVGVRFGMTGVLRVDGTDAIDELRYAPARHDPLWDRFTIHFTDGGSLVLCDPRRLGGVVLDPDVRRLGFDAASLTLSQLTSALKGSSAPLKARLLDQARIAGIGNLLADEMLWRAGLSPLRPAGELDAPERKRLLHHLRRTLDVLGVRGGSHLGDLMEQRRRSGTCPKDGTPLQRETIGGRTTYWCPAHQR